MHESIFISPQKLHLTIAVFALLDEQEELEAIKALQDYKNLILEFVSSVWSLPSHLINFLVP